MGNLGSDLDTGEILQTPESVVYRRVGEELVVVHLDTGHIAHFSAGTEALLDYFRQPRALSGYFAAAGLSDSPGEREFVRSTVAKLRELKFLSHTTELQCAAPPQTVPYARPELLKVDKRSLAALAALWAGTAYAT